MVDTIKEETVQSAQVPFQVCSKVEIYSLSTPDKPFNHVIKYWWRRHNNFALHPLFAVK